MPSILAPAGLALALVLPTPASAAEWPTRYVADLQKEAHMPLTCTGGGGSCFAFDTKTIANNVRLKLVSVRGTRALYKPVRKHYPVTTTTSYGYVESPSSGPQGAGPIKCTWTREPVRTTLDPRKPRRAWQEVLVKRQAGRLYVTGFLQSTAYGRTITETRHCEDTRTGRTYTETRVTGGFLADPFSSRINGRTRNYIWEKVQGKITGFRGTHIAHVNLNLRETDTYTFRFKSAAP
jgi:hypothetical protein